MSGGGVNAGLREKDADSSSTHYVNSHLAADSFTSTSDTLRLAGAVVAADAVTVDTRELYVVSLQDEAHSKSKSQGIHGGISLDSSGDVSGSIGADFQKSTSARKWVEEQSGIIGHDRTDITAQDTTLTGGLIANAAYDEHGQRIDQGNLQLRTDTLTVNDLHDVDKNKTVGGSIGISLSGASADQSKGTASNAPLKNGEAGKEPVPHNTTTVGATYLGHVTEQTTHATLGSGTVIVGDKTLDDSSALNRDLSNAQEITKDQDIGGLNATVTVDNRWFSAEGRADMAQQQKQAAGTLLNGAGQLVATGGALLTGEGLGTAAKASAALSGEAAYVSKDAKGAATIEAYQDGEYQNLSNTQEQLQSLSTAMGGGEVALVSQGASGEHDYRDNRNYVNTNDSNETITTLGHEIGHGIAGPDSESFADAMGLATQLTWLGSTLANSDAIAAAKPGNGINLDWSNEALLSANNTLLDAAMADHGSEIDFRETFKVRNPDGSWTFGDSFQPKQVPVDSTPAANTASLLNSPEQKAIAQRNEAAQEAIGAVTGTHESCARLQNCLAPDPNSPITQAAYGSSPDPVATQPTDELDDIVRDTNQNKERLTDTIAELDAGTQLVAGLTVPVGLHDLGSWLVDTSASDKVDDAKQTYSLAVENPEMTAGVAASMLLLHSAGGVNAVGGAKGAGTALETTNPIVVSGSRAIDKAQSYESGVRGIYGNTPYADRQYTALIDGQRVKGVADEVAVIGGKPTAIEAKFVDDWSSSIRNPASPAGSKPWSVAEQTKMVDQAKKYSSGFDGGAIYHTNSPELASYYSKVFTDAGVTNFKFVITPVTK